MISSVAISRAKKKTQLGKLVVAVDQEKSSPWTWSCHVVVVVSFLLEVAIGC